MASSSNCSTTSKQDLEKRYPLEKVLIYERFFGLGWISPGGETSAKEIFLHLKLRPGQKVLDIGSGLGGAAFYLARQYGVHVTGVDYSKYMDELANQRYLRLEDSVASKVDLIYGSILEVEFPEESLDIIYSRDAIVLIKEKEQIIRNIKKWLKPGGSVLITDYCQGVEKTEKFIQHCQEYKYINLITMEEYKKILTSLKFESLQMADMGKKFREYRETEIKFAIAAQETTIQLFGEKSFDEAMTQCKEQIAFSQSNELVWAFFMAKKGH